MTTHLQGVIDRLGLAPHPEGGYYRETYRSTLEAQPGPPFDGPRAWCTGIYFLLTGTAFSALHLDPSRVSLGTRGPCSLNDPWSTAPNDIGSRAHSLTNKSMGDCFPCLVDGLSP